MAEDSIVGENGWITKPKSPIVKRKYHAETTVEATEGSMAIKRGDRQNRFYFRYMKQKDIHVGNEEKKLLATISSQRGEHGDYFIKNLYSEEDGRNQVNKWQYFKNHGVRVPEVFKPIVMEDNSIGLAIQDLSQNGRYQVLSSNNPEIESDEYLNISKNISPEARERIKADLILDCEVAAGQHDKEGENTEGRIYKLQMDPFMIAINPNDHDDANVYVADFGVGVGPRDKQKDDPASILEGNLKDAARFYSWMTGEIFQLPGNHPLASRINAFSIEEGNKILQFRRYKS